MYCLVAAVNALSTVPPTTVPVGSETDDNYGYEKMITAVSQRPEQVTAMQYLADINIPTCTDTAQIRRCKTVSALVRYNAAFPSCATVEHLLNVAGH